MYARQCSACRQAQGGGLPGTFPPLAGNHDLYRDRIFPVYVLLNGLEGAITVKGQSYNGAMPPFDHLSDAELRPASFDDIDEPAVEGAQEADEALRSAGLSRGAPLKQQESEPSGPRRDAGMEYLINAPSASL